MAKSGIINRLLIFREMTCAFKFLLSHGLVRTSNYCITAKKGEAKKLKGRQGETKFTDLRIKCCLLALVELCLWYTDSWAIWQKTIEWQYDFVKSFLFILPFRLLLWIELPLMHGCLSKNLRETTVLCWALVHALLISLAQ